jgi:hypothetical protein
MNTNERRVAKDTIPTLQATAASLLPGMKHARSLLDVSIRVLEYFETHALKDAANGTCTVLRTATEHHTLHREAENVKALLTAFGRLHGKSH